jgi:hypothetical protein
MDAAGPGLPTTVLLGSPRSGTTWLGEVLDRHHDHRMMFEPLRPGMTPTLDVLKVSPTLDPSDPADGDRVEAFARLLNGQLRDPWMDHLNRSIRPRRRLIKDVRANGLTPWLVQRFPSVPVVVLVRHPVPVVASRLSLGWPDNLAWYLGDQRLVDQALGGRADDLAALTDPWKRAVVQWGLETWVPLSVNGARSLHVASYEVLQRDDEALKSVLAHVGQRWDGSIERARVRRSATAVEHGATGLRPQLDRDRQQFLDGVLHRLGLAGVFAAEKGDPLSDLSAARPQRTAAT